MFDKSPVSGMPGISGRQILIAGTGMSDPIDLFGQLCERVFHVIPVYGCLNCLNSGSPTNNLNTGSSRTCQRQRLMLNIRSGTM